MQTAEKGLGELGGVERGQNGDELTTAYYADGPDAEASAALLDELLEAFGVADERARIEATGLTSKARKGAWRGLPDHAGSAETFQRERVAVLPVLRQLVDDVRALRMGPLPTAEHFRQVRESVPERWNAELERVGSVTLPRLCKVCGVPVLARRNSKKDGALVLSVVCSDTCHDRRKTRDARLEAKLNGE